MARLRAVDEAAWRSRGRIRSGKDGPVYVIRKQVDGRRYEIALGAKTLEQALGESLFERTRRHEKQARAVAAPPPPRREPVHLDAVLAEAFLKGPDIKGNTPRWVHEQKLCLDAWRQARRRRPGERPKGPSAGARGGAATGRASPSSSDCTVAAAERDLELGEDPVHGRFFLPDRTEQWKRSRPCLRHFDKALEHLTGIYRRPRHQGGPALRDRGLALHGGSIGPARGRPRTAPRAWSSSRSPRARTSCASGGQATLEAAEKVAFGARAPSTKRKAFPGALRRRDQVRLRRGEGPRLQARADAPLHRHRGRERGR
jgi:hypothetical protein